MPPAPGITVGLDWIRCTGPEGRTPDLERLLTERFGEATRVSNGAQWFKAGSVWEPGILLSWGHRSNICQIDVQGARLQLMSGNERVRLLDNLMALGLRPSRLDGALDHIGQDLGICSAASRSCQRGELCGLRKYRLGDEFLARGRATKRYLALGARDSAVFVRFYDKGLEQRAAPEGYWERIEAEWKEDRASSVSHSLIESGDRWPSTLASLILGAVDFREQNGRSELARRPRAEWWTRVIAGNKTVAVSPARKPKIFERWRDGHARSYGRTLLAMAETVGTPVGEVVTWLLQGEKPSERVSPVVAEFGWIYSQSHGMRPPNP